MTQSQRSRIRCAIYTRKSSEEGLEQAFNSLEAQQEACEAYIQSQRHEGWVATPERYHDGGFSGGNLNRPALTRLIDHIKQGLINIIVVYKVDRLSRSLADFVKLVDLFDRHEVSFVSVTQQFNTATSMGRLTLNVLLSFAQFEREVTGERIRDKIAASKKKGMWMGGLPPLGYDVEDRTLIVNASEAETVRHIYTRYTELKNVRALKTELHNNGIVSKIRCRSGKRSGGVSFSRGALYVLLKNPIYIGQIKHKGRCYGGEHPAIVDKALWNKVQNQLEQNRIDNETRTAVKDPSLLAGRLFDDQNHVMSPSHSRKDNRRYRYYVSQAVLQYKKRTASSVIRVPAQTIEHRVVEQIKKLLQSSNQLLALLGTNKLSATRQSHLITRAQHLAQEWDELSPDQQIDLIKRFVRKVVVSQEQLIMTISSTGVIEELFDGGIKGAHSKSRPLSLDDYTINLPVKLKRCGIETKLVVPNDDDSSTLAHNGTIRALQQAVIKALTWNQALITGSAQSLTALAKENNVTQRYVAHLIKLAFLSPDIIQAVLRGEVRVDLSLDRLKKGFPLDWEAQRKALSFPG